MLKYNELFYDSWYLYQIHTIYQITTILIVRLFRYTSAARSQHPTLFHHINYLTTIELLIAEFSECKMMYKNLVTTVRVYALHSKGTNLNIMSKAGSLLINRIRTFYDIDSRIELSYQIIKCLLYITSKQMILIQH